LKETSNAQAQLKETSNVQEQLKETSNIQALKQGLLDVHK